MKSLTIWRHKVIGEFFRKLESEKMESPNPKRVKNDKNALKPNGADRINQSPMSMTSVDVKLEAESTYPHPFRACIDPLDGADNGSIERLMSESTDCYNAQFNMKACLYIPLTLPYGPSSAISTSKPKSERRSSKRLCRISHPQ